MKICWDNLENLRYRLDRNQWQSKSNFYIEMDSCENCNESYLTRVNKMGDFCSRKCSGLFQMKIENNPMYDKKGDECCNYKGGYRTNNIPK